MHGRKIAGVDAIFLARLLASLPVLLDYASSLRPGANPKLELWVFTKAWDYPRRKKISALTFGAFDLNQNIQALAQDGSGDPCRSAKLFQANLAR